MVLRSESDKKPVEKKEEIVLYPIKPHPDEKFRPAKVKNIIKPYVEKTLEKVRSYNSEDAQNLCKRMSSEIREKIKNLKLDRYK